MSDSLDGWGLQTRVLHGANRLNETHAVSLPIWQTTTFTAESPSTLAELGVSVHPTEFYTRYGNPTHLVRISVGIEDERDLIADFSQALGT